MASTSFDRKSNALYVKLEKKKIAKTLTIANDIFLDVDNSGSVVGLEILFPKKAAKEITNVLKHSKSVNML